MVICVCVATALGFSIQISEKNFFLEFLWRCILDLINIYNQQLQVEEIIFDYLNGPYSISSWKGLVNKTEISLQKKFCFKNLASVLTKNSQTANLPYRFQTCSPQLRRYS